MKITERLNQIGKDLLEVLEADLVLDSHVPGLPSPLAGRYLQRFIQLEAGKKGISLTVNYNPKENWSYLRAERTRPVATG